MESSSTVYECSNCIITVECVFDDQIALKELLTALLNMQAEDALLLP